ncbi:TPA: hypothetical protein DCE37_02840 [Candidatus Latescibacteria bacterium]|nr:hypothetical protein [Candidatus Latescibacterota bacterium]
MVGESVLGIQVRDVRTVIGYLRSEKYTEISIKGWVEDDRGAEPEGTGWDDPERDEGVARRYVEPAGVVLALLVGELEDVVLSVDGDVDVNALLDRGLWIGRWMRWCLE